MTNLKAPMVALFGVMTTKRFITSKKTHKRYWAIQVFRHTLGTPQASDEMVYEETNKSYYTGISKSKDGSSVFIWHSSTEASGVSVIDANNAKATA